ncbi:MAG: hypothetical protein OXC62_01955 [Aestuariivita sp.]|nr:hypothetical protein [Aestuariivita sp.]
MNIQAIHESRDALLIKPFVKRLVTSVRIQAMAPSKTFFSAASSDEAVVIGYDRMTEWTNAEAFTPDANLATN